MRMSWMSFCQESSWHNFLEEEKARLNCSTLRVHWFTDEENRLLKWLVHRWTTWWAGSVSWSVPPGRLTLVDYTMHNAVIQEPFCTTHPHPSHEFQAAPERIFKRRSYWNFSLAIEAIVKALVRALYKGGCISVVVTWCFSWRSLWSIDSHLWAWRTLLNKAHVCFYTCQEWLSSKKKLWFQTDHTNLSSNIINSLFGANPARKLQQYSIICEARRRLTCMASMSSSPLTNFTSRTPPPVVGVDPVLCKLVALMSPWSCLLHTDLTPWTLTCSNSEKASLLQIVKDYRTFFSKTCQFKNEAKQQQESIFATEF